MPVESLASRGDRGPVPGLSGVRSVVVLGALILLNFAIGGLGAYFTSSSVSTWYQGIPKPVWTPPGAVFGPVWSTLYVLIAVSAWMAFRSPAGRARRRKLLLAYGLQLLLNGLWSFSFFYLRSPLAGLVNIVLLDVAAVACALQFWRSNRRSGLLFLPYVAWILFATVLNAAIFRLAP